MSEVRGGDSARTPGEFRRSQNWIGGSSPGNARFVPPPVDEMNRCLDEWEKSVHNREQIPPLLHIGMLHAQFETIHPFLDGNGRVGRLLVTFLLTEQGVLVQPPAVPLDLLQGSSGGVLPATSGNATSETGRAGCGSSSMASLRPRPGPPTRFGRSSDCATRTGFGCPNWAGRA